MSIKDRLCQHLCQVGFHSKQGARFASLVDRWVTHSGAEWTVSRLKSLSDYYKARLQSSGPVPIPSGWATRTTRRGRVTFRDDFVSQALSSFEGKGLIKAQSLIRSYQIIVLKHASTKQVSKFLEAVETPTPAETPRVVDAKRFIACGHTLKALRNVDTSQEAHFVPLSHWSEPSEKRSPVLVTSYDGEYRSIRTARRTETVTRDIEVLLLDKSLNSLWNEHPEAVSHALCGHPDMLAPVSRPTSMMTDVPAGTIGFIQEGGAKLRSVANPFLVIQALGEPLKAKLEVLCKHHPSSHVHDQAKAHTLVASWLSEGKRVFGFDASSFTDRFPYDIQRAVLLRLWMDGQVSEFDISVMDAIVKKHWLLPKKLPGQFSGKKETTWAAGQPMGFGPSFFLATLTHIACVEAIFAQCGRPVDESAFAVVGDDIIINDEVIANGYRELMSDLGVEINMLKSMISNEYAEFCGKIITQHGPSPSIKTKLYTSADQVVDSLTFYGTKGYNHLSPRERSLAIRAFLPTCIGGLGFKPKDKTYKEYLKLLDVDHIQEKLLLEEVKRFYKNVSSRRDVEASLHSISKWYDLLGDHYPFSVLEWKGILKSSDFSGFSDWTGLPAQIRPETVEIPAVPDGDRVVDPTEGINTFRQVIDNYARGLLSSEAPSKLARLVDVHSRVLDTVHGYIKISEKPPLRPITTTIKEAQDGQRKDGSIHRSFSRGFTPPAEL